MVNSPGFIIYSYRVYSQFPIDMSRCIIHRRISMYTIQPSFINNLLVKQLRKSVI